MNDENENKYVPAATTATPPLTPILTPTKSSKKKKKKIFEVSFVSPVPLVERKLSRSNSFTSPTKTSRKKVHGESKKSTSTRFPSDSLSKSLHIPRNAFVRPHEIDGNPLKHWDPSNFKTERDATCRKVYIPKDEELFMKNLSKEDYQVMRGSSTRASCGGGGGLLLSSQSMHSNISSSVGTLGTTISTLNTMEQPHFSKYNRFFPTRGYFCCKGCGNPLYSITTKFNNFDGYPAFGQCIDGSLEVISWEEQQKQRDQLLQEQRRIEELERLETNRKNKAAIKIQKLMRGSLTRIKLSNTLDELINDLQERKMNAKKKKKIFKEEDHFGADPLIIEDDQDRDEDEEDEPWDMTLSRHSQIIDRMFFMGGGHDSTNTFNSKVSGKKSCISGMSSTSGGSFFDDDDNFSDDDDELSFASFGGDDDDDNIDDKDDKKESTNNSHTKRMKRQQQQRDQKQYHQRGNNNNQKEEIRNWLQEEPEEGRNEIHCHRCKSHIGSVKEKQSKGRKPNQLFKEHHRVNGRAIKYLEDDLPKRTNYQATLLFANQSQARLMGGGTGGSGTGSLSRSMHGGKESNDKIPEFLLKRASKPEVPFVSPRSQRKKVLLSSQSSHNNSNNGKPVQRAFPKNSALEKLLLSRTMH